MVQKIPRRSYRDIDIFHNLFSSKNLIKSHFLKQKICFFFGGLVSIQFINSIMN